jgi:hypothetical protein
MTATQVERLVGRRHEEVCGEQSRSGNKDYLVKRIAWRMQANEFRDLPERARRLRRHNLHPAPSAHP